ncbi:MAG: hypothetical protein ABIL01_28710 [Pseudomonadota bacterium]
MKRLMRISSWAVRSLFAIIAALTLYEIIVFSLRNEASAQDMAKVEFVNECVRHGLDPTKFTGPQRIERHDRAYEFVWKNPKNGDEIGALVAYLPVRADAWLLTGEEMRAIKERFKLK